MFRFDKFNNFERWGRSLMALAIVLLSLIVVASPASAAQTCNQPGSSHCYMLSTLGPVVSPYAFTGFEDEIYPHCLSVTNPSSDFVTAETWLAYNTSYWIEAGVAYGNPVGGQMYFYWADDRPGSHYYEHDDTSDTVNPSDLYTFIVDPNTSTSFNVNAGPWPGESTGWPANYLFNNLQTGSETSNDGTSATIFSRTRGLEYFGTSGDEHANWLDGPYSTTDSQTPSTWGSITVETPNAFYQYNNVSSC